MGAGKENPRRAALRILNRFFADKRPLKDTISRVLDDSSLQGTDRRFVFNLIKGTVRYYLRSDYLISCLAGRNIERIDPAVLNILRMGVYQCHFMDSVPAYSVVDESVKLTKGVSRAASGFVNAVMRRITEIKDSADYIDRMLKKEGAAYEDMLSITNSFPLWLIRYWMKYFGRKKTSRICKWLNHIPVFYIRSNKDRYQQIWPHIASTHKNIYRTIAENLKNVKAEPVTVNVSDLEDHDAGFRKVLEPLAERTVKKGNPLFGEAAAISSAMGIEKETLYRQGVITVQDLSSQIGIKYFLQPRMDENILDCCAAPGGKASFAAQLMKNTGSITAVDKSPEKKELLEDNLKRLGVKNTSVLAADASVPGFLKKMEGKYKSYYDRIIVDAPCTALGTIAKNPEVKYNRSTDDIKRLSNLSLNIMSACHPYLKPGGRMMLYTCTISPEENGQTVRKFISLMNGKYCIASYNGTGMELEIMPYYAGSEGGYVCVLEKKE